MTRFLTPLIIFVLLSALLLVGLSKDPNQVPSPLVGQAVPVFELETLAGKQVDQKIFNHQVSLLNVWATWCQACRAEHEQLMSLAKQGVRIIGLDYKDERNSAEGWLADLGDPYELVLFDGDGRTAIDWGVYGTPETFIVDQQGIIRYKHIGPISKQDMTDIILPMVRQLSL